MLYRSGVVVIVVGNVGDGGLVWYAKLFAVGGGDHIVWGWMAAANMVGKGLLLELVLLLLGGRTAGTGAAGAAAVKRALAHGAANDVWSTLEHDAQRRAMLARLGGQA